MTDPTGDAQSTLSLAGPRGQVEPFAALFDLRFGDEGLPASVFEVAAEAGEAEPGEGDAWRFALTVPTFQGDEWLDRLALLADEKGFTPGFEREDHGDVDWVSMTLRALAPVRAGRFLVHGSHDRAAVRAGDVGVEVDAGLAFGTGHHGTTAGCLDMLERVLRRRRPRRVMDVGTGSAVLAIAVAKAARVPVLASDIDATAVRVARGNAAANGVGSLVRCVTAPGFHHRAFRAFGAADLVVANILAGPLKRLAAPMRRHLAPGAHVVLSGLLPHQAAGVAATYRLQGLVLEREHRRDGWSTLLLKA